jgi:hypothetical protein
VERAGAIGDGAAVRELGPVWPEAPRLVPDEPLPPTRFLGDLHPHPRRDPAGSLHGAPEPAPGLPAERWREDRTYRFGIDLYHAGYLWEAHEQWEAVFFASASPPHRDLVQALIQLAAAMIQAHRGRGAGVRILAAAVVRRLESAAASAGPDGRIAGLDPRALLADVRRHFAPALSDAADDAGAARTVGPAPRLATA